MQITVKTPKNSREAIEFAVTASALKHTVEGDYNCVTVSEAESSPTATAPIVYRDKSFS